MGRELGGKGRRGGEGKGGNRVSIGWTHSYVKCGALLLQPLCRKSGQLLWCNNSSLYSMWVKGEGEGGRGEGGKGER